MIDTVSAQTNTTSIDYFTYELNKTDGLILTILKLDITATIDVFVSTGDPNPDNIVYDRWVITDSTSSVTRLNVTFNSTAKKANQTLPVPKPIASANATAFFGELLASLIKHTRQPADYADYDLSPPRKLYPNTTYNVFVGLRSSTGKPANYTLTAKKCNPALGECVLPPVVARAPLFSALLALVLLLSTLSFAI